MDEILKSDKVADATWIGAIKNYYNLMNFPLETRAERFSESRAKSKIG